MLRRRKKKKKELFWPKSNPHVGVGGCFNSRCQVFSNLLNTAEIRLMGNIKVTCPQVLL